MFKLTLAFGAVVCAVSRTRHHRSYHRHGNGYFYQKSYGTQSQGLSSEYGSYEVLLLPIGTY